MVRRPDIARTVFQLDPSLRIEDLMVRVKGANSDVYKTSYLVLPKSGERRYSRLT
jgi:hypothetical protein